jgi:hypothetical protein
MHDSRFVSENFNPDVLAVVPSARQQRAEVRKALFWRRPGERLQASERPAALDQIWSSLTHLGPPRMMIRTISTLRRRAPVEPSCSFLHDLSGPVLGGAATVQFVNSASRWRPPRHANGTIHLTICVRRDPTGLEVPLGQRGD